MKIVMIHAVALMLSGCAVQSVSTDIKSNNPHVRPPYESSPSQKPTAMAVLKSFGLMTKDEYSDARFIPNSKETMIVADVKNAPCRMVFQYVITKTDNYWMPNQISCTD